MPISSFERRDREVKLFPFRSNSKCLGKRDWSVFLGKEHDAIGLAISFGPEADGLFVDRKSTRLNSSHVAISYAVFCSKKKIRLSTSADASQKSVEPGSPTRNDRRHSWTTIRRAS